MYRYGIIITLTDGGLLCYMVLPCSVTDIDECLQDLTSCSPLAECINTVGSYECECLAGFDGDGKTCTGKNKT